MPLTPLPRRLLVIVLAALVLCLPAAWNGGPLLYPDTPTYLRGAETGVQRLVGAHRLPPWIDSGPAVQAVAPSARAAGLTSMTEGVVLAGRSVYYGALLYAAHLAGGLAWAALAQALATAWLLHLLVVRRWGAGDAAFLALVAGLALATPLAVFTGLLMPDLFAGLGILAMATLAVSWRRLARAERWALAGLLLFSLSAHPSHLAVAMLLLPLMLGLRRWRAGWEGLSAPAMLVVAGCIAGAWAAEWAFNQAVVRALGAPPLRLPHATARLVDMGPGADFLRRHCPAAGYAACDYAGRGPMTWTDFLFSTDPARGAFAVADAATRRRLSDEQLRLALDVLRHDPPGVLAGLARDLARQALRFEVDLWGWGPRELAMFAGRVPPATLAAMQASPAAGTQAYNRALTVATWASTAAAVALAATWAWRRRRPPVALLPQRFEQLGWLVVAGVAANAAVCAVAAAPLDRFQARVVWLLPFLAGAALALSRARRGQPAATAPMPGHTDPTLQGAAP